MKVQVIFPAAGRGTRLGAGIPKSRCLVGGVPLFVYAMCTFQSVGWLEGCILAVPPEERHIFDGLVRSNFPHLRYTLVDGGIERQDSVAAALAAIDAATEIVAIHDVARPFVSEQVLRDVVEAAAQHGAATVAVPVVDTILEGDENGFLANTPNRARLWACQTPQVFRREVILRTYAYAAQTATRATDDATLAHRAGAHVKIVRGTQENFKITTPFDLAVAEWLVASKRRGDT